MVTVEDAAIEVGLRKMSENGKALAGAEFKVTGMFADGTTEKTLASAQDGTATLASLIAGASYTITEQKAPDGHKRIEEGYTFTVGSDGTLAGEAGAGYAIVDDGLVLQVTNEEIPPGDAAVEDRGRPRADRRAVGRCGCAFVGGVRRRGTPPS